MINWRLELAVGEWLAGGAARTSGEAAFMVRFTDLTGLWLHLVEWPERADAALMISSVVERFVTLLRSEAVSPCMEYSLAMLPVSLRVEAFEQLLELELAAITARGRLWKQSRCFIDFRVMQHR
ncbi:MAG UNVERIFIED_CONTAM: hypothetical protein LVR18_38120 [Planctomycetaceae bacterium]|jgi:hypothetical protein